MFLTDCRTCGLRELRGPRSIQLIVNGDQGPALVYTCTRCATVNVLRGRDRTPATGGRQAVPSAA